jgi:MYXO-CTERM domain-containing protein
MKVKTLSVLAGLSAPLILCGSSDARFTGVTATSKPNPFGIFVCNVYAEFDNPGNDFMLAVAGAAWSPMLIEVVGGTFWNHPAGGDTAPNSALFELLPSLAYDTFVTIGVKATGPLGQPADFTNLVNMPPLAGTSIATSSASWAVVPPNSPQVNPFDPVNSYPGNGQSLIGQFSTTNGIGITGTFLMQYTSDGVVTATTEGFVHPFPTPGALGLFGLAGLLSTRRRHR